MGFLDNSEVASFTGTQSKMFTVPQGIAGIKGIFIRGANLSKALVEASDGRHRSTVPARDIAAESDPEEVTDFDFIPLNWRLEPGTTIDITPTTSSATVGNVYVLWAESLSEDEMEWKNKLFTNTDAEPIDLVQVPHDKPTMEFAFCRGPDLESLKCQAGNRMFYIQCRNVAVNADAQAFDHVRQSNHLQPDVMIQAISVNHGTGGASDLFCGFR